MIITSINAQDIEGNWKWTYQTDKHETELVLRKTDDDNYTGDYCSVFYRQSKIDCYDEESSCIELIRTSSTTFEGTIRSNFEGKLGRIRLMVLGNNTFQVELIEKPLGEYYFPASANFVKF